MWAYITPWCIRVKKLLTRCLCQVNGLQDRWERLRVGPPGGSHNSSESNRDIRPRVRITIITHVFIMFGSDRLVPSLRATSTLGTVAIVGGDGTTMGIRQRE
jgi:hypothetical protein